LKAATNKNDVCVCDQARGRFSSSPPTLRRRLALRLKPAVARCNAAEDEISRVGQYPGRDEFIHETGSTAMEA
jgi:hypothetical protein